MMQDTVKERWDTLREEGDIHFYPEQNKEMVCQGQDMKYIMKYVPERANRIGGKKSPSEHPLGEDITRRKDCLYEFDELALLANNRPVERYHGILCTKKYLAQNAFTMNEIRNVTKIVETTGIRSFLNMRGAAATLNHFHTQVIWNPFQIENMNQTYVTEHVGYLPNYPSGNVLITGELDERCALLEEKIKLLEQSDLPLTERNDGSLSERHLFTLLFWDNHILLIPRKKETSKWMRAMVGGLELSGFFLITAPLKEGDIFAGVDEEYFKRILCEVTFDAKETSFLLEK